MKILIAGASGLIGSAFTQFMQVRGSEISILVRHPKQKDNEIFWDPDRGILDSSDLEGFDAIVNFAGENIASGRWSPEKKKKILESRVNATKTLAKVITILHSPPQVFINASAIGFYGDRGNFVLTEESAPGSNFLAEVCQKWEAATLPVSEKGIRTVLLRTGVVLSSQGGALKKMLVPFKLGLGGILGSGNQYMSWIAIDDICEMLHELIAKNEISGPVNAVSPNPVTNQVFTKTLGKVLHRPTLIPMPSFLARLAFGEAADELLLSSARVIPQKLAEAKFNFRFHDLEAALVHLC